MLIGFLVVLVVAIAIFALVKFVYRPSNSPDYHIFEDDD